MQDRFRFRVWDKEHMIYDAEFAYDTMTMNNGLLIGTGKYFQCEYFGEYLEQPERYIVMQSTGLKDKNGKLIYEGDIVKNGLHNDLVEWYKGGFWVNGFINGAKWNIHYSHQNLEVIGNIYETPESLEVKC